MSISCHLSSNNINCPAQTQGQTGPRHWSWQSGGGTETTGATAVQEALPSCGPCQYRTEQARAVLRSCETPISPTCISATCGLTTEGEPVLQACSSTIWEDRISGPKMQSPPPFPVCVHMCVGEMTLQLFLYPAFSSPLNFPVSCGGLLRTLSQPTFLLYKQKNPNKGGKDYRLVGSSL